ncbi:MAG: hypothetical protein ACM32F_07330, partial [Betaproteobacteria bacterium]
HLMGLPWLTDVRFARWDAILARPVPRDSPYLQGLAAYARGTAFARTGDVARAQRELTALHAARRAATARKLRIKNINRAADVLAVAESLLRSELAAARGAKHESARHAQSAVKREQALQIDEPAVWPLPALQALGHAQLLAKAPRAALDAYRRDLTNHPANAYSLAGSAEAQRRLGETALAEQTLARAREAWSHADVPLPAP